MLLLIKEHNSKTNTTMKKYLSIAFVAFMLFSCTVEPVETETVAIQGNENQLRLPAWLSGNYNGVQTQQPLLVSEDIITFAFLEETYSYEVTDIVQEIHEEGRYTLITSDDTILIFNQTTKEDEINMRFNELNLGWFVLVQP